MRLLVTVPLPAQLPPCKKNIIRWISGIFEQSIVVTLNTLGKVGCMMGSTVMFGQFRIGNESNHLF